MEVYLGKIYTPNFGNAAPSVPSFIGTKVIFWWKSCVHSASHISWQISFKFCTDVHHSQIYTPIVFFLQGQRSYFGSHSRVCSNSSISWRISFIFCMEVYHGKIYTPIVFGNAAPSVSSFIGSKVIFWWKCVRSAGHISWWICMIVKSTHLSFVVMLPSVFRLL